MTSLRFSLSLTTLLAIMLLLLFSTPFVSAQDADRALAPTPVAQDLVADTQPAESFFGSFIQAIKNAFASFFGIFSKSDTPATPIDSVDAEPYINTENTPAVIPESLTSGEKFIVVSPGGGPAPITLDFSITLGDNTFTQPSLTGGRDLVLDFGDGSDLLWLKCTTINTESDTCEHPIRIKHAYTAGGDYTMRIRTANDTCGENDCPTTVLDTLTITLHE